MSSKLDMTATYATHNALRRDLEHIARITGHSNDDPQHILRTVAGWELFKKALYVHHTTEDETLWNQPDDLALLDAMEAEHAAIDPVIEEIDAAIVYRGPDRSASATSPTPLATNLIGHLEHEEREALPLIDATLTLQQWQHLEPGDGLFMRHLERPCHDLNGPVVPDEVHPEALPGRGCS